MSTCLLKKMLSIDGISYCDYDEILRPFVTFFVHQIIQLYECFILCENITRYLINSFFVESCLLL